MTYGGEAHIELWQHEVSFIREGMFNMNVFFFFSQNVYQRSSLCFEYKCFFFHPWLVWKGQALHLLKLVTFLTEHGADSYS